MKPNDVAEALLAVLPHAVYHYAAPDNTAAPYIVWAEDSQGDTLQADNTMLAQAIEGTADYFTDSEYDPNIEKIQRAFNVRQIPFRLNSVQYERETGLVHHEWVWQVGTWQS